MPDDGTHEIVPDGVDAKVLSKRMSARSETPREERDVCPECESVYIDRRVSGGINHDGEFEHKYRCARCGARFDNPDTGYTHPAQGGDAGA